MRIFLSAFVLVTRPAKRSKRYVLGHNFNRAADLYTKAIELNPKDATLWCNRAYTRIKLEEHGYALSDASESCRVDIFAVDIISRDLQRLRSSLTQLIPRRTIGMSFRSVVAMIQLDESPQPSDVLPTDSEAQTSYHGLP